MPRFAARSLLVLVAASVALCAPQGSAPATAPEDKNLNPLQELQLSEFVTCLSRGGADVQQRAVDVLKRANVGAAAFHDLPCSDALPSQASNFLFGSATKRTTVSHKDVGAGFLELQETVAEPSAEGTKAQGLASGNTKRASFGDSLNDYRAEGESQYGSHRGHRGHGKHYGRGEDHFVRKYADERRQSQDTWLTAALDSDNLKETIRSAAASSATAQPAPKQTSHKLFGVLKRDGSSNAELESRQAGGLPRAFDPFNGGELIDGNALAASATSGNATTKPTSVDRPVDGFPDTVQGVAGMLKSGMTILRKRLFGTLKALQQLAGPVASTIANAGHKRNEVLERRQRGAAPASPNRRPPAPGAAPAPANATPSASSSVGKQSTLTNLVSSVSQAGSMGDGKRSIHDNGHHAVIDPVLGNDKMQARDSSANAIAAEREAVDADHNVNIDARLAEGTASDGLQDMQLHLDSLSDLTTALIHPDPTSTLPAGVSIQTLDGSANKPSPRALIDTGKISNQLSSLWSKLAAGPRKKAPRALMDTGKTSNQLSSLTGKLKRDVGLTFADNERRSPLPPSRMSSSAEEADMSTVEDAM